MRKDVQLVIRAKDEAGRAVDSITDAINSLVGAQTNLSATSQKTDGALGQLGAALGQLDKELRGISATDKIAQQFDRANAASDRLERGIQSTTREYNRLSAELKRAAFEFDSLSRRADGANAAQDRQKANLREVQASQKALTTELRRATSERNKLVAADTRLTAQIEKQNASLSEASQKYIRLSADIERTTEPSKRLQNSFEAAGRALLRQDVRLDSLRQKQEQTRNSISRVSAALEKLEGDLGSANGQVARQEGILGRISQNYTELRAAASAAGTEYRRLDQAVDKTADSLARQRTQAGQAEENLTQLAFSADRADQAMRQLADGAAKNLRIEIAQQVRATQQARAQWNAAQQTVTELASRMRQVAEPSARLRANFDQAREAARQAKAEFTLLRNSVGELRQIASAGGGFKALGANVRAADQSVASLTARNERFSAAQARTNNALRTLRQQASGAATAVNRVGAGTRNAGRASVQAAGQTDRLSAAYRRLQGDTRRSLSFTQRLRGELLSLIATYAGFFAAVQGASNVVDAFQTLEGATSRLNVVFNGDREAVAEELDFIRREADRLGIEFGTLAQEYTKFAVATRGTNLEGENTRKIFTSVAEAARVNKTSTEDLQGVFVALTQIVSKGSVQMEELRQQLGDRLPGALQIMAAGLGFGADRVGEFVKALENGEISSDALINFADELDNRFGAQLPAALKTTTTEIGRFRNAFFQALLTFGEGGFIESFTGLLQNLTSTLQSADFQAFLGNLSATAAVLVDILSFAVENFDKLVTVGFAFVGLKLVSLFTILTAKIGGFAAATNAAGLSAAGFSRNMIVAERALRIAGVSTGRARVAMVALTRSFKAFLATSGVGLVVLAASFALGQFVTAADKAQEAMTELQGTVDEIKNAYQAAEGDVDKFNAAVDGISTTKAREQLLLLREEVNRLRQDIIVSQGLFGGLFDGSLLEGGRLVSRANAGDEIAKGIIRLKVQFRDGEISARDYRAALDELGSQTDDRFFIKSIARAQDLAEEIEKAEEQANNAAKAIGLLDEGGFERQQALDSLRGRQTDPNPFSGSGDSDKEAKDAERRAKATREQIELRRFEVRQQQLLLDGLDDQARREKVIFDARKANPSIAPGQLDELIALSDELAAIESLQAKAKLSADISEELQANADAARFELEQVGKTTEERELALAIREKEIELAKEGLVLGEEQIAQIRETVALRQEARSQEAISEFREGLRQDIANKEFELELRDKEIIQREQAKAVREAEQAAQAAGTELTNDEIDAIKRVTAALFEKAAAEEKAAEARERANEAEQSVSNLRSRRDALAQQFEIARQNGDEGTAERLRGQIATINQEMIAAIGNARMMWQAIGGPEAQAAIEKLNLAEIQAREFAQVSDVVLIDWARVGELFASGLTNAFDQFAEAVANGENVFGSALTAFRQFASDFLRQIAQMIIQQTILNAISGFTGGIPGLGSTGVLASIFHEGGIAGRGTVARAVNPSVFDNAGRFHEGGLPGLRSNEVPAILEKNEEVLTADDPRNILNGGATGGGSSPVNFKSVNVIDGSEVMEQALRSPAGEEVFLNFITANSGAVQAALEG